MSDAIVNVLVGVGTSLVTLLVELMLVRAGRWQPRTEKQESNHESGRALAAVRISAGRDLNNSGEIHVTNIHNTVSENIRRSSNTSDNHFRESANNDFGRLVALVLVAVGGTALLAAQWPILRAVLTGLLIGTGLTLGWLYFRSRVRFRENWPRACVHLAVRWLVCVVGSVLAMPALWQTTRNGVSLMAARGHARSAVSGMKLESVGDLTSILITQVKAVIDFASLRGVLFLELQLVGLVFAGFVLVGIADRLVGWNAYLRFTGAADKSGRLVAAATKFDKSGWSGTLGSVVAMIVFWLTAHGQAFDLVTQYAGPV